MEMNKILQSVGKHILYLYTTDMNKYAIQIPFLAEGKGKKIYITNNPEEAAKEFKDLKFKISVVKPSEFNMPKKRSKIVMDASSEHIEFERKLNGLKCPILCTYDITKLKPVEISKLAELHDKLILTHGSATILSSPTDKLENLDDVTVEQFVKDELPVISLALILNNPMSGRDLMKALHKNFNVLVSPGTLYPLLKSLEKKGLLTCEYKIKNKIYTVSKGEPVKCMINNHVQARKFVSKFLENI